MNTWHDGQFDNPVKNVQYQRRAKNQAHYAKKEAQRQLRKDLRGTPEDQRINKLIWRWVTAVVLGIGALIYYVPAWVLGVGMLVIVALVAIVAISSGVKQGRGE